MTFMMLRRGGGGGRRNDILGMATGGRNFGAIVGAIGKSSKTGKSPLAYLHLASDNRHRQSPHVMHSASHTDATLSCLIPTKKPSRNATNQQA